MASWPAEFPGRPRTQSHRASRERAIWEFRPDGGRPIRGKKQTDSYGRFSGVYRFATQQLETFWFFYETTLNRGLESFTMVDPSTGSTVTVEFATADPPEFVEVIEGQHEATLMLRVLS